ncbi:MAG TPA: nuclear transport factor 2 family protein [Planctomycetota bacterium]|nr:nuclear transport factor 2 family protein [Planctomycetota bacterium]
MQHALALTLALLAAGCATHPEAAALLDADRTFARDVGARGVAAWVPAFDEHGVQLDDAFRPVVGHDAIRAHMTAFFADRANDLSWEPDAVKISNGGRMGATSGTYRLTRKNADGTVTVVETGRYFDVWRKLDDGTWKLLFDGGDADPAPGR